MKVKLFLFLGMFSFLTYATPTWMDIGTYALSNGPTGCTWLSGIKYTANQFYSYAQNYLTGNPSPSHPISIVDNGVTVSTVSGSTSNREYCDFVWVGTHGDVRQLFLWNASGNNYEIMRPSQMAFGTSYNRWVYLGGCHVLKYDNYNSFFSQDSSNSWSAACKGVQCILGFASFGYPLDGDTWQVFWYNWTGNNGQIGSYGIWDAYREAVNQIIYEEDKDDITPAIVTSRDSNGHYFWDDTFQQAASTRGVNWATGTRWYVYGDPQ
jgi:hypothetical protein